MFTLNCKGRMLVIDQPIVMGIINVTPDSFYSGSRKTVVDEVLRQAEKMIGEGAAILDIGGQSTRPGSEDIGMEGELARVIPAIEAIKMRLPESTISIDTYYSRVALEAVSAGACMVNDISSGTLDNQMIPTVAALNVPYIAMHMKGTPKTMNDFAHYEDVTLEVLDFFIKKVEECREAGIKDVIVDVGFGFAKTIAHNFTLLKNLSIFKILEKPLLVGLSRKATIYKTLGTSPEEALNGTTVLNTIALQHGASILRVHDVKEAVEAVKLTRELQVG
ncbi:dihydropteroate synthase [Segetibacter sp.]|jgi:dihydropteroate synthase|uniref:dihydropteroate synthase n=1 Tax=Segetibacter sp. TaxID=2231182 RepID=UPI002621C9B1|nr:dihydropteroate synthase [Segetibacter sp.]MCW3081021.1 dihydropteroate synthase [Segetibacter sp.]